jgi:hypothetical protein
MKKTLRRLAQLIKFLTWLENEKIKISIELKRPLSL